MSITLHTPGEEAYVPLSKSTEKSRQAMHEGLFSVKNSTEMDQMVDAIESHFGRGKPKKDEAKPKSKRVAKILHMSDSEDAAELNSLLNDKKYNIVYFNDNWTQSGQYNAFVIYEETITDDVKKTKSS